MNTALIAGIVFSSAYFFFFFCCEHDMKCFTCSTHNVKKTSAYTQTFRLLW
jgi:hypothetical protein